jgi:hypothetical protein
MKPEHQPTTSRPPLGVYRTTGLPLVFGCAVGAVMAALGIVVPSLEWLTDGTKTLGQRAILTAFGVVAIGMGYYITAGLIRGRVILYDDSIETIGILKRRRLAKADILGKAMIWGSVPMIALYPRLRGQRNMLVQASFGTDATFENWMATLPTVGWSDLRVRPRKSN